uniref:Uncharacterized protein n=1 Tax=Panagrolaimus sp. PS1159 TaxID=55785 RepID=A0AC35GCN6_9BILA
MMHPQLPHHLVLLYNFLDNFSNKTMDSKSAMTEALNEHDSGIMHNIKEGAKNLADKIADAVVPEDQKAKARANPYN